MTGYLQRLLNRSQPASAPTASPGVDASLARPAMPSRSSIAAADQRLHDPALASLIGMTPPGQPSDPDLPAPEARFDAAAHRDFAGPQPVRERDAIAPANRQARRPEERPLPTPAAREATPSDGPVAPSSTSAETSETARSTAPAADSDEIQPAPAPVEHPLRRLDIDYPQPPAEAPLQPTSPPPPTPGPQPLPETARPTVPEFRPVKERGPDSRNLPVPELDQPSASADSPPHPAERQQASISAETPHTAEPPPLPAPPPPPSPEPETIIIEKTEPAPQVVRTERPAPEAKPPEPVERPRPRPKTAAAASLIGPLPQRMRVRTLFGVRRR